ncbi:MAG: hypothetical protein ACTS73_02935 [Arsenophonus sp. NEOnobi-MAG3]
MPVVFSIFLQLIHALQDTLLENLTNKTLSALLVTSRLSASIDLPSLNSTLTFYCMVF